MNKQTFASIMLYTPLIVGLVVLGIKTFWYAPIVCILATAYILFFAEMSIKP